MMFKTDALVIKLRQDIINLGKALEHQMEIAAIREETLEKQIAMWKLAYDLQKDARTHRERHIVELYAMMKASTIPPKTK